MKEFMFTLCMIYTALVMIGMLADIWIQNKYWSKPMDPSIRIIGPKEMTIWTILWLIYLTGAAE